MSTLTKKWVLSLVQITMFHFSNHKNNTFSHYRLYFEQKKLKHDELYLRMIPSGAPNSCEADNHPALPKQAPKYNLKNLQFSHTNYRLNFDPKN